MHGRSALLCNFYLDPPGFALFSWPWPNETSQKDGGGHLVREAIRPNRMAILHTTSLLGPAPKMLPPAYEESKEKKKTSTYLWTSRNAALLQHLHRLCSTQDTCLPDLAGLQLNDVPRQQEACAQLPTLQKQLRNGGDNHVNRGRVISRGATGMDPTQALAGPPSNAAPRGTWRAGCWLGVLAGPELPARAPLDVLECCNVAKYHWRNCPFPVRRRKPQ